MMISGDVINSEARKELDEISQSIWRLRQEMTPGTEAYYHAVKDPLDNVRKRLVMTIELLDSLVDVVRGL